jgi:hypothetical protein
MGVDADEVAFLAQQLDGRGLGDRYSDTGDRLLVMLELTPAAYADVDICGTRLDPDGMRVDAFGCTSHRGMAEGHLRIWPQSALRSEHRRSVRRPADAGSSRRCHAGALFPAVPWLAPRVVTTDGVPDPDPAAPTHVKSPPRRG